MKLDIEGVQKDLGELEVIKELSLQVKAGELVTLLGPSGSGKSTILNLIGGMLLPDKGDILLDGKLINGEKGLISYMPQQTSLLPWRNVLKNIVLGQELSGNPDKQAAMEWLRNVGLEEYAKAYPHQLSGGMKQRVAFLRALLSPQELMCLDEPFSALDEFTRLEMQQWLLSIWEQRRKSILFITHSIDEALFLSDRIYILSKRPATVKEVLTVPFARPRQESILFSHEFAVMKRKIYSLLKPETILKTEGEWNEMD